MTNTWDHYGKHDPYFGVLSSDEFRGAGEEGPARDKFFRTGVDQVEQFLSIAELAFGSVTRGRALNYGCGVGRLSRALSDRFTSVIGVDLSPDMITEARRNTADRPNLSFELAESMGEDKVDFVISKIVFQHIPPATGLQILTRLAARLDPGGQGVIDMPIAYTGGAVRNLLRVLRERSPIGAPVIPMYVYDLQMARDALVAGGVTRIEVQRVEVARFHKAIIAFKR